MCMYSVLPHMLPFAKKNFTTTFGHIPFFFSCMTVAGLLFCSTAANCHYHSRPKYCLFSFSCENLVNKNLLVSPRRICVGSYINNQENIETKLSWILNVTLHRVQKVEAARADAEKIRLIGEAEATSIEAVGKAEAERMRLKASAYKQYGDAAMVSLILETLPKVSLRGCLL